MSDFATLADYETAYPGSLTGDTEPAISQALEAACEDIRRYCSQTFTFVEDDEITLHGTGRATLLLPELPVVAINSVTINAGLDSELVLETTDWRVDPLSGTLYRSTTDTCWPSRWPLGFLNITVDYDHGYQTMPRSLIKAAVRLANQEISNTGGRISSETIAGYSYTKEAGDPSVYDFANVLDMFRAKRIPVA